MVQERTDHIRIELKRGPAFDPKRIPLIQEKVQSQLGEPVRVEVTQPARLSKLLSGKRHPIISRVSKSKASRSGSETVNKEMTPPVKRD